MRRWGIISAAIICCVCACSVSTATADVGEREIGLDGDWYFALDPMHRGEQTNWHAPPQDWQRDKALPASGWDTVEVPHCWSTDPRYRDITRVWYRRAFDVPPREGARVYRLQFGAVFYACRVWINGKLAGAHSGGYLPFELDITGFIEAGARNMIAVEVDNSWSLHSLPGARPGELPRQQLYPWWNWGGLLRSVRIVVQDPVYIANQRVITPKTLDNQADFETTIAVRVRNSGQTTRTVRLQAMIANWEFCNILALTEPTKPVTLSAGDEQMITLRATIPANAVSLWSVDHPIRYWSMVSVYNGDDVELKELLTSSSAAFGFRTLEVRDAQFLLNGNPVKLAGANRVLDDPKYGGLEPAEVVERDMGMMKRAHLEFARLQHYPCSPDVLDWADRNGFLIIAEAASWGLPPEHLDDPAVRDEFKKQMRAMIEQQWNHPCIVGWSVGNEYESWSPEGVRWTKDMKAFVREIDDTRPVVFVGLGGVMKQDHLPREQRSLHYSDILCINCYMNEQQTAELLDRVHAVWPDRPILITEYGKRSDRVESEQDRVDHFHNVLDLVRQRPFICGLSYWTFNDYRSRYPATNPNGYRPWGAVTPEREPRALYDAMRTALAPATLAVERTGDELRVRIDVRSDFPAYRLEDYTLRLVDANGTEAGKAVLPPLAVGAHAEVSITVRDESGNSPLVLELVRPTGFVAERIEVSGQ